MSGHHKIGTMKHFLFSVLFLMNLIDGLIQNQFIKGEITQIGFIGDTLMLKCPVNAALYEWRNWTGKRYTYLKLETQRTMNLTIRKTHSTAKYSVEYPFKEQYRMYFFIVLALDRNSLDAKRRCYMESEYGKPSYPCFIASYKSPSLIQKSEGSKLNLSCKVGVNHLLKENLVRYTWYKKNSKNRLIRQDKFANKSALTIPRFSTKDEGRYICFVRYLKKNISRIFDTKIIRRSPELVVIDGITENITIDIRHRNQLSCEVKTMVNHKLDFNWGYFRPKEKSIPREKSIPIMIQDKKPVMKTYDGNKRSILNLTKELLKRSTHFVCMIITTSGLYERKDYFITLTGVTTNYYDKTDTAVIIDTTDLPRAAIKRTRSRLFLWILIPVSVIVICVVTGLVITIRRYYHSHNKYHNPQSNLNNKQYNPPLVTPQQLHQQPQLQHSYTKYDSGSNSINTTKSGVPDTFHLYDYQINNNNNNSNAFTNNKQNFYLQQQQQQQQEQLQQQNIINPNSQSNIHCYSSSGSEKMII